MTELKTATEKSHNSAVGRDEVHYSFLKQIPKMFLELLLKIYNDIWTGKQFSKSWKQATVIPIPKSGKNTSCPENYQPIALTSCLSKTLERIVNHPLVWYLKTNNKISNEQYGYKKKGCIDLDKKTELHFTHQLHKSKKQLNITTPLCYSSYRLGS